MTTRCPLFDDALPAEDVRVVRVSRVDPAKVRVLGYGSKSAGKTPAPLWDPRAVETGRQRVRAMQLLLSTTIDTPRVPAVVVERGVDRSVFRFNRILTSQIQTNRIPTNQLQGDVS